MGPHDWRPTGQRMVTGEMRWRCQRCGADAWTAASPRSNLAARPDPDGCSAPVDVPLPWGGSGPAGSGGSGAAAG